MALGFAVLALSLAPAVTPAQEGARDSVVYVVSRASRFQVKTGKAGLLGFAGHEHVIAARAFTGRIVHYPGRPADSRVAIVVPADSLEVLTPPDTAEIRKVTEAMRTQVLHVDEYHEIALVSTEVTPTDAGFRILGRLTLAGQTRDVAVDVRVRIAGDTIWATGTFSVKQTDFGIKPYRGGPAGTVRVADRVTLDLEAVAVRSPGP